MWAAAFRAPLAAASYLLTGTVSRPVSDLKGKLAEAGFRIASLRRDLLGCFLLLVAEKA